LQRGRLRGEHLGRLLELLGGASVVLLLLLLVLVLSSDTALRGREGGKDGEKEREKKSKRVREYERVINECTGTVTIVC